MGFARALKLFHRGEISRQELYSEVDRVLAESPANLPDMLEQMERTAGALHIAPEVVDPIRAHIAANTGYPMESTGVEKTRLRHTRPTGSSTSDMWSAETAEYESEHTGIIPLQVGEVLSNRFRLEKILGTGGMSQVFLAEDLQAYGNPHVALKVLSGTFSGHADAIVTLKRETSKAQLLAHPNIVNVRDFGQDGPYTYMWMEYLAAGALRDKLRNEWADGAPQADAVCILEGICAALDYAHGNNIVHADLKPGNVMFSERVADGTMQAKIIDFGIARPVRALEQKDEQITIYDPGKLHAMTIAYASPEMQDGQEPDPRDDIYALGCIAYEMFTGKHPFNRISAGQAMELDLKVEAHESLEKPQLQAIRRALSFERQARTATAGEFLQEFRRQDSAGIQLPWKRVGLAAALALVAAAVFVLDPFSRDPYSPGSTFRDCAACPAMTVIDGGTFRQGSPDDRPQSFANERPLRTVSLARPFAIGTNEVTVDQFRQFVREQKYDAGGCLGYEKDGWIFSPGRDWSNPSFDQSGGHPVTCVSWQDAMAYTEWLSARTGFRYRLPSASEWEYTAAAGSASATWWSDRKMPACDAANLADEAAQDAYPGWKTSKCSDGVVHTAVVGSFAANVFGINDILGNVFEWVADCWNQNYVNAPLNGSAWTQGRCAQRELRGGSWFTQPELISHTFRNRLPVGTRTSSIGFRVVRELTGIEE